MATGIRVAITHASGDEDLNGATFGGISRTFVTDPNEQGSSIKAKRNALRLFLNSLSRGATVFMTMEINNQPVMKLSPEYLADMLMREGAEELAYLHNEFSGRADNTRIRRERLAADREFNWHPEIKRMNATIAQSEAAMNWLDGFVHVVNRKAAAK